MSTATMNLDKMNDHDLLVEMVKSQRTHLNLQKIMTGAVVAIFAALAISLLILVPKTVKLLAKLHQTVDEAEIMIAEAGESLDQIDEMVGNLNVTITDNSKNLTEAVEKMNNIDFETLNQAINDFSDTVEPMARFFNQFKR